MKTYVLYHGSCLDGFGGAYAAWKKFGDTAEYVPLSRSEPPPEVETDSTLYFIDFTYTQEVMDSYRATAGRVVVLDHHAGVEEVVKSFEEHVFDNDRSGAGIAWDYFHPETPRPTLLKHVEDDDLFRFAIPDTKEIITYLEVQPLTFEFWDEFAGKLDDAASREAMLEKARVYREYFEILAERSVESAKLVSFEGHEVFFAYTHPLKSLKSLVGNKLATAHGPFALVVSPHPLGYGISIRGDGSVDVSKIAQKYGGNGHPRASGFHVSNDAPMPWTVVESDETPLD